MGKFLHRINKTFKESGHTPFYDSGTWIHNPDLSNVSGIASKYWKITGDVISEMTQGEKDTVDVKEIQKTVDNKGTASVTKKLTTVERDSITTPINGMLIFNTTLSCLQVYENGKWVCKSNRGHTHTVSNITDFESSVDTKISNAVANVLDTAPEALNTLKELSNSLGDDPNFATTITTQIGTKAGKATTYTKTEVDSVVSTKADQSSTYTKTEMDTLVASKEEQGTSYTKAENNVLLDTKTDEAYVDKAKAEIISRGLNLVTNGFGTLNDNTNFSSFEFDASQTFSGAGGFKSKKGTKFSDEIIAVDANQTYELTGMIKADQGDGSTLPKNYVGVTCYDIDGKSIKPQNVRVMSGTTTTLAQDLNQGDTEIHLTSSDNWLDTSSISSRYIILWNYKNSKGYNYGIETYSQYQKQTWVENGINRETHVITLTEPWDVWNNNETDGSFKAGHPVSNTSSGATYKYITNYSNKTTPETWDKFSGIIGGINYTGADPTNTFRPGTAGIKLMFLINYAGTDTSLYTYYSNMSLKIYNKQFVADGVNDTVDFYNQTGGRKARINMVSGDFLTYGKIGVNTENPMVDCHIKGKASIGTNERSYYKNILNVQVGSNSAGQTNGIAFIESNTYQMNLGYDGTGSGDDNKMVIYAKTVPVAHFNAGGDIWAKRDVIADGSFVGDGSQLTGIDTYTQAEADTKISTAIADVLDTAPGTLDTLNELASALGDDPNFATTVTTQIGTKADKATTYTKTEVDDAVAGAGGSSSSYGRMYREYASSPLLIGGTNAYRRVQNSWNAGSLQDFTVSSTGMMTYTGSETKMFKIDVSMDVENSQTGTRQLYYGKIYKNGMAISGTRGAKTADYFAETLRLQGLVSLSTNQAIEIFVANGSNSDDVRVSTASVIITSI